MSNLIREHLVILLTGKTAHITINLDRVSSIIFENVQSKQIFNNLLKNVKNPLDDLFESERISHSITECQGRTFSEFSRM